MNGTPSILLARGSSGRGVARGQHQGGRLVVGLASGEAGDAGPPQELVPLAPPPSPEQGREEMDMRSEDDDDIFGDAAEELQNTFGADSRTPLVPGDGGDGVLNAPFCDDLPDEATARAIASGSAAALAEVDVGDGEAPLAAASSGGVPVAAGQELEPLQPWLALGEVTKQGYIYDATPRSVMRIQRGKPKRSVTINCYYHPSCSMLLTEDRCPDDMTLKRWLYEVPPAPPGCSRDEAKRLAEEHMTAGKSRWGGVVGKSRR